MVYQRPALWVVVRNRDFMEPVRQHVVPRYERRMPLPAPGGPHAGPPVTVIERAIGRTVRTHAIGDGNRPGPSRTGGGTVWFYRPRATAPVAAPPRADAREPQQARPQTGQGRPYAVPIFIPVPQAQPASPGARPASTPRPTPPATAAPAPGRPQAAPAASAPHAAESHPAEPHAGPPHAVAPKSSSEQPHATERP
jgi:hypothetical protein